MKTFYVTFGQRHPLRDHFVIVTASSYENARAAAMDVLGIKWAFIYEDCRDVLDNCPGGVVGATIEGE